MLFFSQYFSEMVFKAKIWFTPPLHLYLLRRNINYDLNNFQFNYIVGPKSQANYFFKKSVSYSKIYSSLLSSHSVKNMMTNTHFSPLNEVNLGLISIFSTIQRIYPLFKDIATPSLALACSLSPLLQPMTTFVT